VKKVIINTSTFGQFDSEPLQMLKNSEMEYSLNPHGRVLSKEEVMDSCKNCEGMIAGTEPLDKEVLDSLPDLKVISRCGVGMDNVDLSEAKAKGIKVFNTPFGPTQAVAELTVGVTLNMLRKINFMQTQMKADIWKKHMGSLICGKNIGIIGFGRIGQKVGELFYHFGAAIRYHDMEEKEIPFPASKSELDELLAWADILCLHLSARKNMPPVVGQEEINKMKKGSWLVNMSRGGAVDEEALCEAVRCEHLSGAALDVFEREPYSGELKSLDHVVLTPHIGSYAKEARISMEVKSVENVIKGLS